MKRRRHIWHYVFVQPCILIYYAFFQPIEYAKHLELLYQEVKSLSEEEQISHLVQKLFLPLILSVLFFTLFIQISYNVLISIIYYQLLPNTLEILGGVLASFIGFFFILLYLFFLASVAIPSILNMINKLSKVRRNQIFGLLIAAPIVILSLFSVVFLNPGMITFARGIIIGLEIGILLDTIYHAFSIENLITDLFGENSNNTHHVKSIVIEIVVLAFIAIAFFYNGSLISNAIVFVVFILSCIGGYLRLPFYLLSGA